MICTKDASKTYLQRWCPSGSSVMCKKNLKDVYWNNFLFIHHYRYLRYIEVHIRPREEPIQFMAKWWCRKRCLQEFDQPTITSQGSDIPLNRSISFGICITSVLQRSCQRYTIPAQYLRCQQSSPDWHHCVSIHLRLHIW